MKRLVHLASTVMALCLVAGMLRAQESPTVRFDIPAQALPSALMQFSRQSGVQVTGSGEILEGKSTAGVTGTYAIGAALETLLAGTGLAFDVIDPSTVAIRAAAETGRSDTEPTLPIAVAADEGLLAEVIVTGTRRSDVTVADSSTPIDVIPSEKLQRQGYTDINDLLRNAVPSFNAKTFSVDSYAVAIRPFSLRGLSPDQTLVLVNGKRRHRSAIVQLSRLPLSSGSQGPDLSTIPSIAIERVEVLRDGAAAQYGSDAIAGVINFQLKRSADGADLGFKGSQYYAGDGEAYQAQANFGLPLLDDGFVNVSAEYGRSRHTQRGQQRADAAALIAAGNTAIADPAQLIGEPSNEIESVFVNAEQPWGALTTYLFANFANHEVESGQFFRNPDPNGSRRDIFASVPLTTVPGGARFTFASLFPGGLLPFHTYRVRDASATGGVRGEFASGLKYDFSGGLARSWAISGIRGTVNPSLGPTAPTRYRTGLEEQREAQLHADFVYDVDIDSFATPMSIAFGGEYREETFELGAGEADSYRAGPFARVFDPDTGGYVGLAIGSSAFPGVTPSQAGQWSRGNSAVYLDVGADVAKGLSFGLAGRFENFSDFGNTFNYKVSSRYRLLDWLTVRGSWNTGFHAPSPGQSHVSAQSTSVDPVTGLLRNIATVPVETPVAAFYGAKPLQPEQSKNYSLGAVVQLGNGSLLTLDYFHIDIDDRLGVTSNIPISTAERAALTAAGVEVSELNAVAFFANAFDTTTEGFDAVLSHSWTAGGYKIDLDAAVNHTKTDVTRITFPLAIDRERRIEISTYYPEWRAMLSGTIQLGPWSLASTVSYYGKYTDAVTVVTPTTFDQEYGAEVLVDLELGYDVTDKLRVVLGGSNIFDNYPGREGLIGNRNNGFVYTQNSPFGYNGGFWYARCSLRL